MADVPNHSHTRGIRWSWTIEVPTIITLVAAAGAALLWAGAVDSQMRRTDERLAIVERRLDSLPEKVAIIEERTRVMERSLVTIEDEVAQRRR